METNKIDLQNFIERIEKMEEEKASIQRDIKEIYAEAEATGYDVKAMKQIIKFRKMDKDDLAEFDEMTEAYRMALGV